MRHCSRCWLLLFGSSLLSAPNLFSAVAALEAFLELERRLKSLEGERNASLEKKKATSLSLGTKQA